MSRRQNRKTSKDKSYKSSSSSSSSSELASREEDEIDNKQVGYENQIEKLEERIKKLKSSANLDYNMLWATTRECAQLYNKLGEHNLKGESPSDCEEFFEKAANLIESHPNKEVQKTSEWKALKISIYKNFSQYYSKIGNHESALNALKHILPQQKELEDMNIILPGVEFLYINMADLAFKLKNYNESFRFAEMASKLLERQLNISEEEILAMKMATTHQKHRIVEDSKVQLVRSRKFIALSYCLYLAGKSLMKGKKILNIQQAVPLLEKAYLISNQYMGMDDKITKSYKKKYENALGFVNKSKGMQIASPEIFQRRNESAPTFKMHTKTKSLIVSPRNNFSEPSPRYFVQDNKKIGSVEGKLSTLLTDRDPRKTREMKGSASHKKMKSAQWTTDLSQNRLPSPMIIAPHKGLERKTSQGTIPSGYISRKKSDFTMENNDLMIFDASQTPLVKRASQASTNLGDAQSRNTQTHTSLLRTESVQQFLRFPDNFSKLIATETTALKEQLTASSSRQDYSHRQYIPKKTVSGILARPSTAALSYQRSSADQLINTVAHRSATNQVPRIGSSLAGDSKTLKEALTREGMNTALVFLTDRPQTGQSRNSKTNPKISPGISTFSGKLVRPSTAVQKSARGVSLNQNGVTEWRTDSENVKREEIKQRPTSAALKMPNKIFAVRGIHPVKNSAIHLKEVDNDAGDDDYQPDIVEDPLLGQPSPTLFSLSRRESNHLFPQEEDPLPVNFAAFTERPYQKGNTEMNLTTSQTEELDQILDLNNHLQQGLKNAEMKSEFADGRTTFTPLISKNYIKNIQGPRKNLSKELVEYLKVTSKQDSQAPKEGLTSKKSLSPGLRDYPESPTEFLPQNTGNDTTGNHSPYSPLIDERAIIRGPSNRKTTVERSTMQGQAKIKVAKDLHEFRRMEEEAAQKIQRFYRQRKNRRRKYSDADENSIEMHNQNLGVGAFSSLVKGVIEIARGPVDHNIIQPFSGRRGSVFNRPPSSVFDRENLVRQGTGLKKLPKVSDEEYIRNKFSDSFRLEAKKDSSLEINESQISTISVKPVKLETRRSAHQPYLGNMFSPNAFDGDLGAKPSTSPVKNINLSPKADIIQKNATKLHKLEIRFIKRIQGFVSYWTLRVKDVREGEGNLLIDTILSNEKVVFYMQSSIDFKTAERSMFQFSIWPLVSESKGFKTGDGEALHKGSLISRKTEDELFENPIVILGLKSEKERKKMGVGEEISIRKLLAMLTQHLQQKTTRYHKKNGYVFQSSKSNFEAEIVRNNREELGSYKRKYAEAIKKLSTSFAFHSILHERRSSIIKENAKFSDTITRSDRKRRDGRSHKLINTQAKPSSIEIEDENSGTSIKLASQSKVSHTLLEDEESKIESAVLRKSHKLARTLKSPTTNKPADKKRTMTITDIGSTVSGQNRKIRPVTFSKQSLDTPYDVSSPRVRYSQLEKIQQGDRGIGSFMGFLTTEIECYKNPFLQNEVVLQLVVKAKEERLLVSLKVTYNQSAAEDLMLSRNALEFVFEAEKNGTLWNSSLKLEAKQFLHKISPKIKIDMRSFIINEGFSASQKKLLIKFLRQNLIIEQSQLQFSKGVNSNQLRVYKKTPNISLGDFSTFVNNMHLQKSLIFEAYEDFQNASHHVKRSSKRGLAYVGRTKKPHAESKHKHLKVIKKHDHAVHGSDEESDTELIVGGIQELLPTDPKYGEIQLMDQEFVKEGGTEWLTYYNEIRCITHRRYYYSVRVHSNVYLIRLEFIKVSDGEEILVSMYQTASKAINYTVIRDKRTQERIITILQMKDSNKLRDELLLRVLAFDRTMVGRKLVVNHNAAIGPYNKKFNLTPNNIAQRLISNRDEVLSKHDVHIVRIYKKGNIKLLGNCYLTITIYTVSAVKKFDSVTCLKFEITPFNSKTKFYKFLINSKDLEYYYNIIYDQQKNHKTIDIIIRKMYLKRQKIYSAIELPIQHHVSLANPAQSYSLRNSLLQTINTSSNGTSRVYGRFLEQKILDSRIIIQKLKRVGGQYLLFTIQKHKVLDYWAISIYNPKSCRRFVTSLYFSDILNMNPSFLDSMSPSTVQQIAKEKSTMNDYSRFCVYYNQFKLDRLSSNQSIREDPENLVADHKSMSQDPIKSLQFLGNDASKNDANIDEGASFIEYSDKKFNFMEIKFWENIIESIEILSGTHKNCILKIDAFKGVLREYMYRDIVRASKTTETMMEVFLETSRKKLDILERADPIPNVYFTNYTIFIRMTSLHKMHTYNTKFTLEQGIKLYEKDENIEKIPLLNSFNKIPLANVGLICNFMVYKTKAWNISSASEDLINSKASLNRQMVLPWTNLGLKLNCNLDLQLRVDDQHLFIDRLLIYRNVLSQLPLQMVSIVYYEKKDNFIIYLYDVDSSILLKKKIRMNEAVAYIPYVKQMLQLQLYEELGTRIFKSFKNRLLVHSYTIKPINEY